MSRVARAVARGGAKIGILVCGTGIGMAIAVVIIAADCMLEKRGSSFRMPVLAVAVGIYLPLELSVPILLGGLVAHLAKGSRKEPGHQGLLFAAGLITGEAMLGILLAVVIVVEKRMGLADVLAVFGKHEVAWPGVILLLGIAYWLYKMASKKEEPATS